jgi:diguanylate cyclase (GGDEF)-like protein
VGEWSGNAGDDGPGARWSELPVRAVAGIAAVEVTAVVTAVAAAVLARAPGPGDWALAALLAVLAVVHTELASGIERARRRAAETSYFDLSSVWTFAAALLLEPALAVLVVLVAYAHLWFRVWRPAGTALHRHAYTTATVVLAATAAHLVADGTGGLPTEPADIAGFVGVAAALVAYVLVNTVLVAFVIGLARPGAGLAQVAGRLDDNMLELATLCLGGLTAVALASAPGLVVFALPPILVLHRSVHVRRLEQEAATDAKTGLLTAAAWRAAACQVLDRGTGAGLLIVDIDHFKIVNDDHGHLAGDDVLAAVAGVLRAGVGEQGLVGRFGGEEFVVLLPGIDDGAEGRAALRAVAERLRRRVARLAVPAETDAGPRTIGGLTVSIGAARVPADGTALDPVLRAADACLYAAKRGGRNLVRVAGPVVIPAPRSRPVSEAAALP